MINDYKFYDMNGNLESIVTDVKTCLNCNKAYENNHINFFHKFKIYTFCSLTCLRTHNLSKNVFKNMFFEKDTRKSYISN